MWLRPRLLCAATFTRRDRPSIGEPVCQILRPLSFPELVLVHVRGRAGPHVGLDEELGFLLWGRLRTLVPGLAAVLSSPWNGSRPGDCKTDLERGGMRSNYGCQLRLVSVGACKPPQTAETRQARCVALLLTICLALSRRGGRSLDLDSDTAHDRTRIGRFRPRRRPRQAWRRPHLSRGVLL